MATELVRDELPYNGFRVDEATVPCFGCTHYKAGIGALPPVCDSCLSSSTPYPNFYPIDNNHTEPAQEGVPGWAKPLQLSQKQIGGAHYRMMAIQPTEFIVANDIPWREANVIKYTCRHKYKNGSEDIRKAIHYLEMLLEDYK